MTQNLPECPRIIDKSANNQGHLGTFRNIQEHSGIFRDIQGHLGTIRNNWNFQGLSGTISESKLYKCGHFSLAAAVAGKDHGHHSK